MTVKKWDKENPEKMKRYRAKYKKENLEKVKAKDKARWNVKMKEHQICQFCYSIYAKEMHHEDYSKPLEVIFLCMQCHKSLHYFKRKWKKEVRKILKENRMTHGIDYENQLGWNSCLKFIKEELVK